MADRRSIEEAIRGAIECAHLDVRGDDGVHFEALIVSPAFAGLARVRRHQLVYAALGDRMEGDTAWTVRLHYKPLAPFIWFGALLMAAGGLLSLGDRRLRIGAPSRRAAPGAAPMPAE